MNPLPLVRNFGFSKVARQGTRIMPAIAANANHRAIMSPISAWNRRLDKKYQNTTPRTRVEAVKTTERPAVSMA